MPARPRMPLDTPPHVRLCGTGVHGRSGEESFRLDAWTVLLYGYEAVLELPGEEIRLRPGLVTVVPPQTPMRYRFRGRSEHLFAHFELEGRVDAKPSVVASVVRDPDARVGRLHERLSAVAVHAAASPRRAAAELWSLLFELDAGTPQETAGDPVPPEVVAALAAIETGLHRPLRVADLARAAGVPHNRLTRGFRDHVGATVVGHLRRRRVERAVRLLTTTDRPVASIACEVGVPDLQAFNKLIRATEGLGPRAVRERAADQGSANA